MPFERKEWMTDEQWSEIQADYESDVSGLKTKNEQLLAEKKGVQQSASEIEAQIKAQKEALDKATEEKLKLANDMEGLREHYETINAQKEAELKAQAEKATSALVERDKNTVVNDILSKVDDRFKPFVKTQLENSVDITYNEQGQAVSTIRDGEQQFNSVSDFLDGVKESDSWKSVLRGADSSGAGTQPSTNASPALSKQEEIRRKYNLES